MSDRFKEFLALHNAIKDWRKIDHSRANSLILKSEQTILDALRKASEGESRGHTWDCRSAQMGDLCDCDGPSDKERIASLEAGLDGERGRADMNFQSCERIKGKYSDCVNELEAVKRERDELREENSKLAEALSSYIVHQWDCRNLQGDLCDCAVNKEHGKLLAERKKP